MSEEHCQYCLAKHPSEDSCTCVICGTEMHPKFIVCAIIDGERAAICPSCRDLVGDGFSKN